MPSIKEQNAHMVIQPAVAQPQTLTTNTNAHKQAFVNSYKHE